LFLEKGFGRRKLRAYLDDEVTVGMLMRFLNEQVWLSGDNKEEMILLVKMSKNLEDAYSKYSDARINK